MFRHFKGSVKITQCVGKVAYRLELPPKMKIHSIFHVSLLKPFVADLEDPSRSLSRRPPIYIVENPKCKKCTEVLAQCKVFIGKSILREYLMTFEEADM